LSGGTRERGKNKKELIVRSLFGAVNGDVLFAFLFRKQNAFGWHQESQKSSRYSVISQEI
jgi:hypothetical protein